MPKLTLRDLFAAMTIVAILVAWWLDHRRQQPQPQAQPQVGRYQMVVVSDDELNVIDTATGKSWYRAQNGTWYSDGPSRIAE